MSQKLTNTEQVKDIVNAALTKVKNKNYAVSSTSLAGYGITNAYTKTEIDDLIGATYKAAGTIAGSELTSSLLIAANLGNVYNISSELTITAANAGLFKNMSVGDKVSVGDDVGVIAETSGGVTTYLFNKFSGFVSVPEYTEGNGIDITSNAISIDIDSSNANGLSATSNGLKLDTATTSAPGAMSAADKVKLTALDNSIMECEDVTNSVTYDVKFQLYQGKPRLVIDAQA